MQLSVHLREGVNSLGSIEQHCLCCLWACPPSPLYIYTASLAETLRAFNLKYGYFLLQPKVQEYFCMQGKLHWKKDDKEIYQP